MSEVTLYLYHGVGRLMVIVVTAGVGEVVAKGACTPGIELGQVCVVPFSTACGICFNCTHSLSARCTSSQLFGWRDATTSQGLHGAQSEYVLVPNAVGSLYILSPMLDVEEGVLLGDIASTAAYAVGNAGIAGWQDCVDGNCVTSMSALLEDYDIATHTRRISPTTTLVNSGSSDDRPLRVYVVIGCGPVGLMAVAMAVTLLKYQGMCMTLERLFYLVTVV